MYATVGNDIWTVDTTTGASTLVGNFSGILSGGVMGIMFDENDTLFATAYVPNSPLYNIDLNTLSATVIGNTGFFFPHGGDILLGGEPATTQVLVKNVAPTIDAVEVSATKGNKAMPGDEVTLAATFTDIGLLDRHEVVIQWDDGSLNSVFDVDATADLVWVMFSLARPATGHC